MTAETYRSSQPSSPSRRDGLEREVVFLGVVLVLAALFDVVGVAARGAAFTGLHALAVLTLFGAGLAALLTAARAIGRTLRR